MLRRSLLRWALAALVGTACLTSPAAADVSEPSSGQAFKESVPYAGKTYVLIGVGIRKKLIIKVYAMGLYAEQAAGKQAFPALIEKAGGQDKLLSSEKAQGFVAWGRFGKLGVLRFLRDVDKDKIQEAYRDSLSAAIAGKPPLSTDAQAFVALFDRDMKQGQELKIHTDENGKISMEIAGVRREGPTNPQLARAIWEIWLGQKPISKDMQQSLVKRIEELGK